MGEEADGDGRGDAAWREAAAWIERNGGRVHPALQYDGALRRVYLGDLGEDDYRSGNGPQPAAVDAGTALLEIPDACLVTLHSVEADESFGKSLFGAVHSLSANNDGGGGTGEGGLYHDAQDVILALFLAYLREQLGRHQKQRQSPNDACVDASDAPWLFYRPYLATLPSVHSSESSACLLPRQWPAATLKRRLEGTSLYRRVLSEQRGLRREYELVRKAWLDHHASIGSEKEGSGEIYPFPPFIHYDGAMAALTSRGFAGMGLDGVDALVPMLDLLNHVRGKADGESAADDVVEKRGESDASGPDVRYRRYSRDCGEEGGETPSKRQRTEEDANNTAQCQSGTGGVRVSAARQLVSGSELHMTYGAKGNAALLGRYGFCIANNVEPDGSCNDVLELDIRPGEKPVELQRGPKAYSYAPFVRALDLCRDASCGEDGWDEEEVDEGLDAFLDSCENGFDGDEKEEEEDDVGGFDEYLYNAQSNADATHSGDSHLVSMKRDLNALVKLKEVLRSAKAGLQNNSLLRNESPKGNATDEDRYCTVLVRSEIQTLDFYLAAVDALNRLLLRHREKRPTRDENRAQDPEMKSMEEKSNNQVDWEQINALVNTYVSIRYPGIDI
ncbi:hypothetical protein ACHAXT_013041 [Thalassiosira profunda]